MHLSTGSTCNFNEAFGSSCHSRPTLFILISIIKYLWVHQVASALPLPSLSCASTPHLRRVHAKLSYADSFSLFQFQHNVNNPPNTNENMNFV